MKVFVAASPHWLDADTIRENLTDLPVSSTIVVSSRAGGDTAVAHIASKELAFHVEIVDLKENFKKNAMELLRLEEWDCAYFFVVTRKEPEHALARVSRAGQVETHIVISNMETV
jgi:hypothetical protein